MSEDDDSQLTEKLLSNCSTSDYPMSNDDVQQSEQTFCIDLIQIVVGIVIVMLLVFSFIVFILAMTFLLCENRNKVNVNIDDSNINSTTSSLSGYSTYGGVLTLFLSSGELISIKTSGSDVVFTYKSCTFVYCSILCTECSHDGSSKIKATSGRFDSRDEGMDIFLEKLQYLCLMDDCLNFESFVCY